MNTKNKNLHAVLASLSVMMLLLSVFGGVALSKQDDKNSEKGMYNVSDEDSKNKSVKLKEEYKNNKKEFERYKESKENYENAKENYLGKLKEFKRTKSKKDKLELTAAADKYLLKAVDTMVEDLVFLKYRIELHENSGTYPFDISKNIDDNLNKLATIRTAIMNANSTDDLIKAAKSLKDNWEIIKVESRYYSGLYLNNKIDEFLIRADNASARLDKEIQNLKSQGIDTKSLESDLARFNEAIQKAKISHNKVKELYDQHKGFDNNGTLVDLSEARAFLEESADHVKETNQEIKKAFKAMRDLFDDVSKYRGKVILKGTGNLTANGSGRALISGDFKLRMHGINGTLILTGKANVTADGGTNETLGNGDVKYSGFNSISVDGNDITVKITGNSIEIKVEGTGSVVLSGHGTYSTDTGFEVSGEWDESIVG